MADGNFYSIATMDKDKDRELEATLATQKNQGLPAPAISSAPSVPQVPTTPGQAGVAQAATGLANAMNSATMGQKSGYQSFSAALDSQAPFRQKVQAEIEGRLGGKAAATASDDAAAISRNQMAKQVQAEADRRRQESIRLGLGGNQLQTSQDLFKDQALVTNQDLEANLAANRSANVLEDQRAAISDALRLREAGASEAQALGGLQQAEIESLRDVGKSATGLAVDQQEGQETRSLQERLADKNLSWEDKKLTRTQLFESLESDKDRTLSTLLTDKKIAADINIKTMDQSFTEFMTREGWMNDKEMFDMKAKLEKDLQASGIEADKAKQLADIEAMKWKQQSDQLFEEQQSEIQRKFITGERISTQEWESNEKALDKRHDESMLKLKGIEERLSMEQQDSLARSTQEYLKSVDFFNDQSLMLSKEEIDKRMKELDNKYQKDIMTLGFDQQTARDYQLNLNAVEENNRERAHKSALQNAELLQRNKEFWADYGLKQQEISDRRRQIDNDILISSEKWGLDKRVIEEGLKDSNVNRIMEIATIGIELAGDDTDAMAPFVDMMAEGLSSFAKDKGISTNAFSDFSKNSKQKAFLSDVRNNLAGAKTMGDALTAFRAAGKTDQEAIKELQAMIPEGEWGVILNENGLIRDNMVNFINNIPVGKDWYTRVDKYTGGENRNKTGVIADPNTGAKKYLFNGKPHTDWTKDDWSKVSKIPEQMEAMKEEGILKDGKSFEGAVGEGDFTSFLENNYITGYELEHKAGAGDNEDTYIRFNEKNRPLVLLKGKPYFIDTLASVTWTKSKWGFDDEYRGGKATVIDPVTGEKVRLNLGEEDI